jgi:chemotaxis protein MotB
MHTVKTMFVILMCTMFLGCVSQQAHERAIEELKMTTQNSVQESERLQQLVEQEQAEVSQLQEANQDLEATIEVQEQIKEKNLVALKKELQTLYSQVSGLGNLSGVKPANFSAGIDDGVVDFDDLAQAFQSVRSSLAAQISDFSELRAQNGHLEEELQQLEARLRHVERLKKELEQVRAAREAQESKLAKVRREVQTVSREIDRITKALEGKFGKSLVVTQHQDRLVLTMLGQVLFESGEGQLTPLGLDIMKQVGEVLASLPNKNIQVEGHTDNNPIYGRLQQQYPTNWELSTARATTVLRFLIEQTGMNPTDFSATGYADTRPAVENDSEEGRAQNRRVEIVLYPERVLQDNKTVATLAK